MARKKKKKILLDKTATWIFFLPYRPECHEFYTTRLDDLRMQKEIELVFLDHIVRRVKYEIKKVCEVAQLYWGVYENNSQATDRSVRDFYAFVRDLKPLKPKNSPKKSKTKKVHANTLRKRLLTHIRLLGKAWVRREEERTFQAEYEELKDGFNTLKRKVTKSDPIPSQNLLSLSKLCTTKKRGRTQCLTKELITKFLFRRGKRLQRQTQNHIDGIVEKSISIFTIACEHLKIRVPGITGSASHKISTVAHFLVKRVRYMRSKGEHDDYLIALARWAKETWQQAQCSIFLQRLYNGLKKPCLCNYVTGAPFALGTSREWMRSNSGQLSHLRKPDGFFSFDRRLGFCLHLQMRSESDFQGVECRSEFKYYPSNLTVRIQHLGSWHKLEVIDRSITDHGYSARSSGLSLSPYRKVITEWHDRKVPLTYLNLNLEPANRLRFRYMFDVEPDHMQVIAGQF
jgi:hypothetical protein